MVANYLAIPDASKDLENGNGAILQLPFLENNLPEH